MWSTQTKIPTNSIQVKVVLQRQTKSKRTKLLYVRVPERPGTNPRPKKENRMTADNPEQRTELSKYYKWVKKCKLCGQLYGTDGHEENKNTCPKCIIHRWKK